METVEYGGLGLSRSYFSTNQELRDIFLGHIQVGSLNHTRIFYSIPDSPVFRLGNNRNGNEELVKILPMMVIQKELEGFESERYDFRGEFSLLFRKEPASHTFASTFVWGRIFET
jgi:hypothetical protein